MSSSSVFKMDTKENVPYTKSVDGVIIKQRNKNSQIEIKQVKHSIYFILKPLSVTQKKSWDESRYSLIVVIYLQTFLNDISGELFIFDFRVRFICSLKHPTIILSQTHIRISLHNRVQSYQGKNRPKYTLKIVFAALPHLVNSITLCHSYHRKLPEN